MRLRSPLVLTHTEDQSRGLDQNGRVFSVNDKGLRKEQAVGTARIESIIEGRLSLDQDIAAQPGDRVYLHRHDANQAMSYAGYSGFSFARVLTGDIAPSMLPHFVAQDLTRDNRIRPNQGWTSQHRFTLPQNCNQPQVDLASNLFDGPLLTLQQDLGKRLDSIP